MRKVFVGIVLAAVAFAPAGCGGSDGGTAPTAPSLAVTTNVEPAPTTAPVTTEGAATLESPEQITIAVSYAGGKLEGGVKTLKVAKGTHVVLDVTSDVDDEVHVHGPDIKQSVTANEPAHLEFDLPDPGRYEVELEQRGLPIADIQVQP